MTENNSNIKKNVMRRVYIIRTLKLIVSEKTFAMFVIIFSFWGVGREVWVAKVFANGPHDFWGHFQYLAYAFAHTHFLVQMLVVLAVSATAYLARAFAHYIQNVSLLHKLPRGI